MTKQSVLLLLLSICLLVSGCDGDREQREMRVLTREYLNPSFSDEFLDYWQIDNLADYRHRMVQEYFLAMTEADGLSSAAGSPDEMVRYSKLLMINWLEEELLLRSLMYIEMDNAIAQGASDSGYPALAQDTLEEELLRGELGASGYPYNLYREWVGRVRAGLAVH